MCTNKHIYISINTCVQINMYEYKHMCTNKQEQINISTNEHMNTWTHVQINTHLPMNTCVQINMLTNRHLDTNIRTNKHICCNTHVSKKGTDKCMCTSKQCNYSMWECYINKWKYNLIKVNFSINIWHLTKPVVSTDWNWLKFDLRWTSDNPFYSLTLPALIII
jgi:hypothetical protein